MSERGQPGRAPAAPRHTFISDSLAFWSRIQRLRAPPGLAPVRGELSEGLEDLALGTALCPALGRWGGEQPSDVRRAPRDGIGRLGSHGNQPINALSVKTTRGRNSCIVCCLVAWVQSS